ncbi:hypothetical protein, partial [Chryseobacterium sp. CH1]|uniref:hypothetical protein n=1 Tax=Chryseobacterium sp. CH1 TaxID=713551 RepID=UPI001025B722
PCGSYWFWEEILANPDYPERVKQNASLNEITDPKEKTYWTEPCGSYWFWEEILANPDYPERVKQNASLNEITDP